MYTHIRTHVMCKSVFSFVHNQPYPRFAFNIIMK